MKYNIAFMQLQTRTLIWVTIRHLKMSNEMEKVAQLNQIMSHYFQYFPH